MKRIILCLSLLAFFGSQAQQINPVPDYVFSNKMSVGRNAVTDTAAYFSIGPRYGAIRGMMPPMVTDTANMSATKRNGLLIFSIQKNKYLYWDSVGSKWAEMAGTTGSALTSGDTASMLSPYIRAAGNGLTKSGQSLLVDTLTISTRAWRRKGLDSLAALELSLSDTASMLSPYTRGSGTTNYLPKFTGTRTLGNSVAFDNGGTELLVNTTSDNGNYALQVAGSIYNTTDAVFSVTSGNVFVGNTTAAVTTGTKYIYMDVGNSGGIGPELILHNTAANDGAQMALTFSGVRTSASVSARIQANRRGNLTFHTQDIPSASAPPERLRIQNDGEVLINTTTDAGAYALQVAGGIYNTTGAVFAASSGNVGIGTTSPSNILHVNGGSGLAVIRVSEAGTVRGFFGGANGMITGYTNEFAIRGESGLILSGAGNAVNAYINSSAGELIIANGSTDAGDYKLQVAGNIYNTGNITTGAPTGGTATAWRLGEVATVSPTSPNRTIRVEIGSQVLYIHAKTTND